MKRRGFFGALLALPALTMGKTKKPVDIDWRTSKPPIEKWVWVVCLGDCIAIGRLCKDGVWERYPRKWTIYTVTHWKPLPLSWKLPSNAKELDNRREYITI